MSSAAPGEGHFWHRASLAANLALAALKLAVGWLAGSTVLVADGLHSLGDVLHTSAAWLGYRWAQEPPDQDHHYGHQSGEAVASVVVGVVLVFGGVGVVGGAWWWGSGVDAEAYGAVAIGVTVAVVATKLVLARAVLRAADRVNSPSLRAVGRDHRADVFAGVLVVVAVAASVLGAPWVEPFVATVLGGLVVREGVVSAREGFDVLMDRVADPTLRPGIRATAASVEGVTDVQRVRVHPLGATYAIDLEVAVDGTLTVTEGHEIAHRVEAAILAGHEHIEGVHVHVNPDASSQHPGGPAP